MPNAFDSDRQVYQNQIELLMLEQRRDSVQSLMYELERELSMKSALNEKLQIGEAAGRL